MNRIERTGRNAEHIAELRRLSPLAFCPNCHMVMGIKLFAEPGPDPNLYEMRLRSMELRCGNCQSTAGVRYVTPEEAYVILDTDLLAMLSVSLKAEEIMETPYMWE
jgi:hypothetical protein